MLSKSIFPVTDIKKQVTDSVVLSLLAHKNIDSSFVEFKEDYNAAHPFSKVYNDLKSNTVIQAISNLPMARKTDGSLLTPGFELSDGKYYLKNNLFDGFVSQSGEIRIACVNDQPFGAISLDEGHWTPELYIGGVLVLPKSSTILETDPINSNYHDNVIEIDYDVCIRRIRVIEGRFRGSWIFSQNPKGSVRIVYNSTGKLQNRLGTYRDGEGNLREFALPVKGEEYLDAVLLDMASYPLEIGDTSTFYPDADTETATVDGNVWHFTSTNTAWAALVASAGTGAADSNATVYGTYINSDTSTPFWKHLYRGIVLFDSSAIGVGKIVTAATLSLYGSSKADDLSITPDLNIYSSAPASNTSLASGDYNSLGSTAFSSAITYSDYSVTGFNDFVLNSSGIANIPVDGISKFGVRNANYDVAANAPSWTQSLTSRLLFYGSEQGTGFKPKLVLTYSIPKSTLMDNSYRQRR